MDRDLITITNWFYNNHLAITAKKTKLMVFKSRNRPAPPTPVLYINGEILEQTTTYKYLGFWLDEHLNHQHHIAKMREKITPFLALLRRTQFLPKHIKINIYYAYIHSKFSYLAAIWGFATDFWMKRMQILQSKAIRMLFWDEYRNTGISTAQLLRNQNIPNINQLHIIDTTTNIYKMKNNILKTNIHLPTFQDVHEYNTRGRTNFTLPKVSTSGCQKSVLIKGLTYFNRLPQLIKSLNTEKFKKSLKEYIISNNIQNI